MAHVLGCQGSLHNHLIRAPVPDRGDSKAKYHPRPGQVRLTWNNKVRIFITLCDQLSDLEDCSNLRKQIQTKKEVRINQGNKRIATRWTMTILYSHVFCSLLLIFIHDLYIYSNVRLDSITIIIIKKWSHSYYPWIYCWTWILFTSAWAAPYKSLVEIDNFWVMSSQ